MYMLNRFFLEHLRILIVLPIATVHVKKYNTKDITKSKPWPFFPRVIAVCSSCCWGTPKRAVNVFAPGATFFVILSSGAILSAPMGWQAPVMLFRTKSHDVCLHLFELSGRNNNNNSNANMNKEHKRRQQQKTVEAANLHTA